VNGFPREPLLITYTNLYGDYSPKVTPPQKDISGVGLENYGELEAPRGTTRSSPDRRVGIYTQSDKWIFVLYR